MALYTFENQETKELVEFSVPMSEYDNLVEKLGDEWRRVYVPIRAVDVSMDIGRIDNGFNDVLKRIKSGSGRSNTIRTK